MPAPTGKLTDPREIIAYLLAHAAGIAWGMTANPVIFRDLIARGYHGHLLAISLAMSIVVSVAVLLIFLVLRKVMAEQGAPAAKFTDLPELTAYVLAHAVGTAWAFIVNPMIFRSLVAQGHRNLALGGLAIGIAVVIVVLVIFLFLRKAMAGPGQK